MPSSTCSFLILIQRNQSLNQENQLVKLKSMSKLTLTLITSEIDVYTCKHWIERIAKAKQMKENRFKE
jgi:hypothetical protein